MKLNYYKELDGIRALAALLVMVFHFFISVNSTNSTLLILKKLSYFGQTGVSLFFVLSGFLITRILLESKRDANFFSKFYIRRSLRIFPLYYFYLLLVFVIVPTIESTNINTFREQIYHWVYLQDFAITFNWQYKGPLHFWSLAVEEHFYLFFPLIIYHLDEKQILKAVYAIILLSVLVRVWLVYCNYETFYFTFSRMDELGMGALLAILERRGKLTALNRKMFIYLFIGVSIPAFIIWTNFSGKAVEIIQVFKYTLISVAYFCAIGFVLTLNAGNSIKKALSLKPLLYTGRISYGLYVYHGICFSLVHRLFSNWNVSLILISSFAFAYFVASLSYYLMERPFLKLKSRFE